MRGSLLSRSLLQVFLPSHILFDCMESVHQNIQHRDRVTT